MAAQALRLYGSSVATIRRAPSVVDVEVPSSRYSVFDTPLFTEDSNRFDLVFGFCDTGRYFVYPCIGMLSIPIQGVI